MAASPSPGAPGAVPPASASRLSTFTGRATLSPNLPPPAPYVARTKKWALVIVVALSFIAAGFVAAPLWIPIILGCVMAISAYRPYRLATRKLGNRSGLAALLMTLAAGLVLAVVGTFVLVSLAGEMMKIVGHLDMKEGSSLEGIIGRRPTRMIAEAGLDTSRVYAWAQGQVQEAASVAAGAAAVVLRATSEAVLGLVVALLTMYYMLREGPGLALRIEAIAPLEPRHTRALLNEAREVGRTAFIGTIFTAIIQGVIAGVGYAALGVPQPVTWAIITGLASFLPMIGTLTIWVPISAWLFVDGHPAKALILAIWGALFITSLADYVIRPRIVGGHGHGHPLLTLIALLGGIEVFGLAGLVIAPIVMSVSVAAFRLYEREIKRGGVPGTTTSPGVDVEAQPVASAR